MATRLITVNDILAGHVSVDVACLDRIYLNGYLPTVQVPGQVVQFLQHRGFPIPSPAVVEKMGPHETARTRFFAVSRALLRMNNDEFDLPAAPRQKKHDLPTQTRRFSRPCAGRAS
jgi:hypothetical protein